VESILLYALRKAELRETVDALQQKGVLSQQEAQTVSPKLTVSVYDGGFLRGGHCRKGMRGIRAQRLKIDK
jgi:hypothetical protein